jgi:ribosomal protein L40E
MHGRKRHGSRNFYSDFSQQNRVNYSRRLNKGSIQRKPINQIKKRSFQQNFPLIKDTSKNDHQKPKLQHETGDKNISEDRELESIKMKISGVQEKISQEIRRRREFVKNRIPEDHICFEKNKNNQLKLKTEFIQYILDSSDFGILENRKTKKRLKKIRLNIEPGSENVFISEGDNLIFGSNKTTSVLEQNSGDWNTWKEIIDLISDNVKKYKFYLKKCELDALYDEYEKISASKKIKENVLICEKCGSENLPKAIYCHYCGHELNTQITNHY